MSLLLIVAALPLAGAFFVRWWLGLRVLETTGIRACRCDLDRWMPSPVDSGSVHRADGTAADFGRELRIKALASWREQEPKAASSRESARRFGVAVPPLSAVVAVFAVLVGKIPVLGAIAVVLLITAVAAAFGLLSLPPELQAITHAAKRMRKDRCFPDRDDEEAVIACAVAIAWSESLPPVLRMIQK